MSSLIRLQTYPTCKDPSHLIPKIRNKSASKYQNVVEIECIDLALLRGIKMW